MTASNWFENSPRLGMQRDALRPDRQRDRIPRLAVHYPIATHHLAAYFHVAHFPVNRCDTPVEPVVFADEARDEGALGLLVQGLGRGHLLHHAVAQHGDAVRHDHGLLLVVGHVDDGHAERPVDAPDLVLQLLAQVAVEGAQGFVHEHEFGLEDQRARDRHPLLLSRPRAARAGASRSPPAGPVAAPGPPARAAGRRRCRARRAERPGCPRRSCGGRARSPETPCRCPACGVAGRARNGHRYGWLPRSESRTPRASSGTSSSPSRTARAGSGTRPCARSGFNPWTAITRPS